MPQADLISVLDRKAQESSGGQHLHSQITETGRLLERGHVERPRLVDHDPRLAPAPERCRADIWAKGKQRGDGGFRRR